MDTAYQVDLRELQPQPAVVVASHVDLAGIAAFVGAAFGQVLAVLADQRLSPSGPPFARYVMTGDGFDVEAGFPSSGPAVGTGPVQPNMLPGGTVATVLHRGDYSAVGAAYDAAYAWLESHGYRPTEAPWESYLDGPDVPEPRTLVQVPCRA